MKLGTGRDPPKGGYRPALTDSPL